ELQKDFASSEGWAATDIVRTDSFASAQFDARAINYFISTRACAENDVLNVFGCGQLVAGIGFLRLPASSTSGVTGVLTYPRKPGGRKRCSTFPLRCDTLPEVFPLNGCRPAARAVLVPRAPPALAQGGFRCAISY